MTGHLNLCLSTLDSAVSLDICKLIEVGLGVFLWALFTNNNGLPTLKATKQKRIVGENTDFQLAVVVGQGIAAPLVLSSALLSESKALRTESKEQNVQKSSVTSAEDLMV